MPPRPGKRPSSLEADFQVDPAEQTSARTEHVDPASVVAGEMLSRALRHLPSAPVAVGAPGSLAVVLVPHVDWTEPAVHAWKAQVHGDARYADGDRSQDYYGGTKWMAFIRPQEEAWAKRDSQDRGNKALAKAMWQAIAVAGFSPDPKALLPGDLVLAADHRLELTGPLPEDIAVAATRMAGSAPTVGVSKRAAAASTPYLLRLARRPDQTADDYVLKLRALVARQDESKPLARPKPARIAPSPRAAPTLERLHGMSQAVAWGFSLRDNLDAYRAGQLTWADVDPGVLLSGPPGVGKTTFVRALSGTCRVPLVTGSYSQWLGQGGGHQGSMLKAMRQAFADAKATVPSLLFIDELDSFPNRGALTHAHKDWDIQVVNALLAEIDGVDGRDGVVLVGACNHPSLLDPALVRSGRLDRHIHISLPDRAALEGILREHLGEDLQGESLAAAALRAVGASGADCERFVRDARQRARAARRGMVLADLLEAISGAETRSAEDLRLVAVHEAGHAVAANEVHPGSVAALVLRATDGDGGFLQHAEGVRCLRPDDVRRELIIGLAGRAAEEAVFGVPSAGSGGPLISDLARATFQATLSVSSFGFDPEFGPFWSGYPDPRSLAGFLQRNPVLAARVRVLVDAAYVDALALMRSRQVAVEAVAEALLDRQVLDGAEVAAIIAQHLPSGSSPGLRMHLAYALRTWGHDDVRG